MIDVVIVAAAIVTLAAGLCGHATQPFPLTQAWRTVTLEMVLVDGRWLVDGWESVEGPSPAGAPNGAVAAGVEVVSVLGWEEVGR